MRLVTPATEEPVTVVAARRWARVDEGELDENVALCIQAAREKAEHTTGRRFITQTWAIAVKAGQRVVLHDLMPVQSVTLGGEAVDIEEGLPAEVVVPADGELRVTCGYGNAATVPAGIKMWIMQRLGYYLENRQALLHAMGSGQQLEPPRDFVDGLLDPYLIPRC
ncbi:head-tail connector protein [Cupriavidus oxalaticus]|uniref:Phage gp6-like head-tail connector protein n=1 Tax=Cupriavidus oxalaticus TaxID=96344 RepID=A0A4P7LJ17_9BURK|nr:hypothetical protein [Cupriavidus oxalaticus]QBY56146.1 hypothetical protein E0W60_34380 [Cupriavidus oxalaticus]